VEEGTAQEVLMAIVSGQSNREQQHRKDMVAIGARDGMPGGVDFRIAMGWDVDRRELHPRGASS
jgi:hypothetical protein